MDPHQATRQKMIDAMQPLRPMERIDTLKQFLDHDRQVLRVSFCNPQITKLLTKSSSSDATGMIVVLMIMEMKKVKSVK